MRFKHANIFQFQDYTPQKTEAMEAEPLLQRGLCGALAMASRKVQWFHYKLNSVMDLTSKI